MFHGDNAAVTTAIRRVIDVTRRHRRGAAGSVVAATNLLSFGLFDLAEELMVLGETQGSANQRERAAYVRGIVRSVESFDRDLDPDPTIMEAVLAFEGRYWPGNWPPIPQIEVARLLRHPDLDRIRDNALEFMINREPTFPYLRHCGAAVLIEVAHAQADPSHAVALRSMLGPGRGAYVAATVLTWSATDRYLGLSHELVGELDEAVDLHEAAHHLHHERGIWREALLGDLDLIRVLQQRDRPGDSDRVAQLVRLDIPIAGRLGLERYIRSYGELATAVDL
jgi:hypothetical protein